MMDLTKSITYACIGIAIDKDFIIREELNEIFSTI